VSRNNYSRNHEASKREELLDVCSVVLYHRETALQKETMLTLFLLLLASYGCESFQPLSRSRGRLHSLNAVIAPQEIDLTFDIGQGGVRLAEESVVKITGTVKHKPGSAQPKIKELLRYNVLTEVKEADLPTEGFKIIATGRGKELYKNPGETTEAVVIQSPHDAVRDSLIAAGSAMEYPRIVVNFCGGNDLQALEVLDAIREMVLDLDAVTRSVISFNSISHLSFPKGSAAVTVVGLGEENEAGGLEGAAKALANGEAYFFDGKYWTVSEKDINDAVE
jgi:hypothetical protein